MNWQEQVLRLRAPRLTPEFVSDAAIPDLERRWVPEKLTPLYGTESYAELSQPQQLIYNQSYAIQLAEEFRWIEDQLIIAPLEGVRVRLTQNDDALRVIESFIEDEHAHVSAFEALRAKGASVLKSSRLGATGRLFSPTARIKILGQLASFIPHQNTFWIEVIRTFEAYAIEISQAYHEDKTVDPTFKSVFVAHGQDEARHVQYDDLLSDLLKRDQTYFLRFVDSKLSHLFLESYYSPEWGIDGPIEVLISRHRDLTPRRQSLVKDAKSARDGSADEHAS